MSINGITFDERYQKALVHGSFNQAVLSDGVLNGCAISNNTTSMTIGIGTMVIGGRLIYFQAAEQTSIVSPTGNYVRFYIKIDLTQTPDPVTFSQGTIEYDYSSTLGGFAALTKEDINEDGNTYECEIAVYSLSGGNIDALTRSIGSSAITQLPGWNLFPYTCTYASATTFTVSGIDVTESLYYGVKFRCYQSGAKKDFYVVTSTFSTNTTVTVAGESDLASGSIDSPQLSIYDTPEGFKKGELWYRAAAYCHTAQSIAQSGIRTVMLDTEYTGGDPNSNFNTGTYKYTAPISGYYQINISVSIATANAVYSTILYIAGGNSPNTTLCRFTGNKGAASVETLCGGGAYYLDKGDQIYVGIYQDSAGAKALEADLSWITVQFLHV